MIPKDGNRAIDRSIVVRLVVMEAQDFVCGLVDDRDRSHIRHVGLLVDFACLEALKDAFHLLHFPALGDGAEGGVGHGTVFVAGEAEVDEPLAVEGLRHILQDADAAQVVLDQVVVGREDAGDLALGGEVGELDFEATENVLIEVGDVYATAMSSQTVSNQRRTKQVGEEPRIHVCGGEAAPNRERRMGDLLRRRLDEQGPSNKLPVTVGTHEDDVLVVQNVLLRHDALGIDLFEGGKLGFRVVLEIFDSDDFDTLAEATLVVVHAVAEIRQFAQLDR